MSATPTYYPVYTPDTHPYNGLVFKGFPPCTYYLDGKRYCPTSWIITHDSHIRTAAILNTQQECEDVVKQWGATIAWQSDCSTMAITQSILAWIQEEPDYAADILVKWIGYLKCVQQSASSTESFLRKEIAELKKSRMEMREKALSIRRQLENL